MTLPADRRGQVLAVLDDARERGLLGPGDAAAHLDHALGFVELLPPDAVDGVDLGTGGGVPGLVVAVARPAMRWTLVDAARRRTAFLDAAIDRLDLGARVRTWTGRAEAVAPDQRRSADVVTARGFGPPPVAAECGAPWLRVGGALVVSEPPGGDPRRWPPDGLATLGLTLDRRVDGPPAYVVLRATEPCPPRFPRRVGVPAKRPLWRVD